MRSGTWILGVVPRIGAVDVVNLYMHNAPRWFGLYKSGSGVHDNYSENIDVPRVMFLHRARTRQKVQ